MAMSFAPDGGGQGYLKGADSPKEHTTAAFDTQTDSARRVPQETPTVSSFHELA